MSGGSLNYVHRDVRNAVSRRDRLDDGERELLDDIADLLHDLEWSLSGDYGRYQYRATLAEFVEEWGADAERISIDQLAPYRTHDGVKVECPKCNRQHFASALLVDDVAECECGVTFGDVTVEVESWGGRR